MFKNLFKKKNYEPLDYEWRKYLEQNICFLDGLFPEPTLDKRKVFLPTKTDFPIQWNSSKENVYEVVKIVAENMQINPNEIEINFYEEGLVEINMGGSTLFLENDTKEARTAGLYHGKNKTGKYEISINTNILNNPVQLIATVAHELSHVKLLGEKKADDDEYLTDLATVFFGFGIFTANASFQFSQEKDRWVYNASGYLKHDEWGYALALFAFMRYEDNPEWITFLNPTIKKEFEKSIRYMIENESEIFKFEGESEQNGI
ncbi:MAG: hypothetical protein FWC10_07820 [Lentimicrobiaceae bacterium]|nr:hypothetical protein [Lentimicrobiaceae bacterium]